jgi:hypothetical protein
MALLHPHTRGPQGPSDGPHPAICLAVGFGVIVVAALAVHILMGVIF